MAIFSYSPEDRNLVIERGMAPPKIRRSPVRVMFDISA